MTNPLKLTPAERVHLQRVADEIIALEERGFLVPPQDAVAERYGQVLDEVAP